MAMIFSAICKSPNEEEDDAENDERDPELGEDEEWMHALGTSSLLCCIFLGVLAVWGEDGGGSGRG